MLRRSLLRASSSLHTPLPHRTIAARIRRDAWRQPMVSLGTRPFARYYSDATSEKEEAKQVEGEKIQAEEVLSGKNDEGTKEAKEAKEAVEAVEAVEVEQLRKELEAKTKEVASLKDSYLRQVADYRNLQDRTAREKQQTLDFALQKLLRDLLPSIDNLGHALALSAVPAQKLTAPAASPDESHKDLKNLHEGVKLMETVLLDVLKKHGLSKIDPLGEKFDPKVHDAVFQAPQEGKEDGVVFHVQNPGYLLNGRVLRAPQVGVVKNS